MTRKWWMLGTAVALVCAAAVLLVARPSPTQTQSNTQTQAQTKPAPTKSATLAPSVSAPEHADIVTTVFWIGEQGSNDNSHISNAVSAWDEQWQAHYGGVDSPTARNGYNPSAFTPLENPFYFALPYSDIDNSGTRKASASSCPTTSRPASYSWCKNAWIAVQHGGKTAYAQWEDVGPYQEDDTAYVFGKAQPLNHVDTGAGLDVSPAVRDYLGLGDVSHTGWSFVSASAVPAGPWHQIITTNPGESLN